MMYMGKSGSGQREEQAKGEELKGRGKHNYKKKQKKTPLPVTQSHLGVIRRLLYHLRSHPKWRPDKCYAFICSAR